LAGYGEHLDELDELGVQVVAFTTEGPDQARGMKEDEEPGFPIAHSADPDELEEKLGLYVHRDDEKVHVQPAQLVLRPLGTVELACYTSGAVGRLKAGEAVGLIRSAQEG